MIDSTTKWAVVVLGLAVVAAIVFAGTLSTFEGEGLHGPDALAALLVGGAHAEDVRVEGPRLIRRALGRGRGPEVEIRDRGRALPVCRADAVAGGVAAADDEHVPAVRVRPLGDGVARAPAILTDEVVHRDVDPAEGASGEVERARARGAGAEHHGVVGAEGPDRYVRADFGAGAEYDAFGFHHGQAPVQHGAVHLEVRDPIAEQSPCAVVALEDRHGVAGVVELVRAGEAGRPRADDGDAPARPVGRRSGLDPALGPGTVRNRLFDVLDGHRPVDDAEDTRALARRRAEAAGELGEVIRGAEAPVGRVPVAVVGERVPVRDDVAEGTSGLAEGHAAVHAAAGLLARVLLGERRIDLVEVLHALGHGPAARHPAGVLQKRHGGRLEG